LNFKLNFIIQKGNRDLFLNPTGLKHNDLKQEINFPEISFIPLTPPGKLLATNQIKEIIYKLSKYL
jgi:hypothetical protein